MAKLSTGDVGAVSCALAGRATNPASNRYEIERSNVVTGRSELDRGECANLRMRRMAREQTGERGHRGLVLETSSQQRIAPGLVR